MRGIITTTALIACTLGTLGGGAARAQVQPAVDTRAALDVPAIVDSLGRALERYHTSADTGRIIARAVREAERAGRYRGLDAQALAAALAADLQAVNGDRHLRVTAGAPAMRPGGAAGVQARSGNYGVSRAEYLSGNVGYLRFTGPMYGTPETLDAVAHALRFLGNADALIIDVRGVPGGSAAQVNFVFSHFVPPATPEVRVVNRVDATEYVRVALDSVPGPRRLDVPLFVLADGRSASAAEALPFALQNAGRATVVGEPTAGAGRNNRFVDIGGGLWASVTFTRVSDPRTGREFEGGGVTPDIATDSAAALDAAHAEALRRLGRNTD
jgi:hypothetical protein